MKTEALYSINDGNQNEKFYFAKLDQQWLDDLKAKYSWDDFNTYDNRMWEYMDKLFDQVIENCNASSNEELWQKLNRPQKVFWSFLAFGGDVDNGGVYQFFFNRPNHAISVLEVWQELGVKRLEKDYIEVLNELIENPSNLIDSRETFNYEKNNWNKRYEAFLDGKRELKSAEKIEDYFYNDEFKRELYKTVSDYIEKNISSFASIS